MSLARESLILLILLLPGFLYFAGLYIPENFSREMTPRGGMFDVAAITIAAFVSYLLVGSLWLMATLGFGLEAHRPGIGKIATLLGAINSVNIRGGASDYTAANLSVLGAMAYVIASSSAGFLLGYATGKALSTDRLSLRRIVRHSWVFDIAIRATDVFVMTNIRVNDCMVVYKGELAQFGLQTDGTFSYIAIGKCCRGMLDLAAPETAIEWHPIGSSHGEKLASILAERGSGFIVRGSEISNVVFERRVDFTDGIDEAIAAAKAKRQREAEEAHVSSGWK